MYRTFFAYTASAPLALVNFPFCVEIIPRYLYSLHYGFNSFIIWYKWLAVILLF